MKNLALLFLVLGAPIAHADDAPGPHGGQIVQNETSRFEVKIDPNAKNVEVYTLDRKKRAPKSMSITLFRESGGTGKTITLKAVSLKDPLPKYQGELSQAAGSYVGAELRFEVSMKSFQIMKFIPYIPSRQPFESAR